MKRAASGSYLVDRIFAKQLTVNFGGVGSVAESQRLELPLSTKDTGRASTG